MRRFVSIFLLLIMLVVGTHPVLAMRCYKGELSSLQFIDSNINQTRSTSLNNLTKEEVAVFLHSDNDDSYCYDSVFICIDDFLYHKQAKQIIKPSQTFYNSIWITPINLLKSIEAKNSVPFKRFSSSGIYYQYTDILTYICIYRI